MGKYKTKAIQADLGKSTHILVYSNIQEYSARHTQDYSGIFRTLCKMAYSEPWYIQNPVEFRKN